MPDEVFYIPRWDGIVDWVRVEVTGGERREVYVLSPQAPVIRMLQKRWGRAFR